MTVIENTPCEVVVISSELRPQRQEFKNIRKIKILN